MTIYGVKNLEGIYCGLVINYPGTCLGIHLKSTSRNNKYLSVGKRIALKQTNILECRFSLMMAIMAETWSTIM
jgi:hypothetical protein